VKENFFFPSEFLSESIIIEKLHKSCVIFGCEEFQGNNVKGARLSTVAFTHAVFSISGNPCIEFKYYYPPFLSSVDDVLNFS